MTYSMSRSSRLVGVGVSCLLALGVAALLPAARAVAIEPAQTATVLEEIGLSITLPAGWSNEPVPEGNMKLMCKSPQEGDADTFSENLNLVVVDIPPNEQLPIDGMMAQVRAGLEMQFPGAKVSEPLPCKVAGREGRTIFTDFTMQQMKIRSRQWLVTANAKAYIFTFTSTQDAPEKFLPEATAAMDSVKIDIAR
jgi:eukaryotic-like serine/threonine-protein kinase